MSLRTTLSVVLLTVGMCLWTGHSVNAQQGSGQTPAGGELTEGQLDKLIGPIALYPDALIANILPASTVPLDIVSAARHLRQKGGKADGPPPGAKWESSVVALLKVPDVIYLMDKDLDWTQSLGGAVIAQQSGVMDAIQRFRRKAYDAGNLKTTEQQVIVVEKETIVVQPAAPTVVYVPTYNPQTVVVKTEPDYVTPLITFGVGVAVGALLADDCDWHHHHVYHGGYYGGHYDVDVDVNRDIDRDIDRDRQSDRQSDRQANRDRNVGREGNRRTEGGRGSNRRADGGGAWKPSQRAVADYQSRRGTGKTPSRAERVRSGLPSGRTPGSNRSGRADPRRNPARGYPSGADRSRGSSSRNAARTPSRGSAQRSSRSGSGDMFGGYNRGSSSRQNASRGRSSRGSSASRSRGGSSRSRGGSSRSRGGGGRGRR